jgi:hypothetical protein
MNKQTPSDNSGLPRLAISLGKLGFMIFSLQVY